MLHVIFSVTAYDESGYGDNRSQNFNKDQEAEAIAYAKSLEPRFGAVVHKVITMDTISKRVWPEKRT